MTPPLDIAAMSDLELAQHNIARGRAQEADGSAAERRRQQTLLKQGVIRVRADGALVPRSPNGRRV